MHLDRRLTWAKHIKTERKELDFRFKNHYWMLGKKSKLSIKNKILIYKVILKPVWIYGIQLWGSSADSNIEIVQRFQNKTLSTIAGIPWYVRNKTIHKDLQIHTVREEIVTYSSKYENRLSNHPNHLALSLLDNSDTCRRLKRFNPADLPVRYTL